MPTPEATSDHLHLLIPELPDLLVGSTAGQLPEALAKLCLRALPLPTVTQSLAVMFAANAPLAAFAWQHDRPGTNQCSAAASWVARADPVHMQADMTRVHLLQVQDFALQTQQADAMIDSLQPLFEEHGLRLTRACAAAACERWYVLSPQALPYAMVAPTQALGRPLEDSLQLPATPAEHSRPALGQRFWIRLQAEAQMVLHQHAVNQQREQSGLPTLNSLWFWGSGRVLPHADAASNAETTPGNEPGGWTSASVQSPQLAGFCEWQRVAQINLDTAGALSLPQSGTGRHLLEWRIDRQRSQSDNWQALAACLHGMLPYAETALLSLQAGPDRCLQLLPLASWRGLLRRAKASLPLLQKPSAPEAFLQQMLWLADMDQYPLDRRA